MKKQTKQIIAKFIEDVENSVQRDNISIIVENYCDKVESTTLDTVKDCIVKLSDLEIKNLLREISETIY